VNERVGRVLRFTDADSNRIYVVHTIAIGLRVLHISPTASIAFGAVARAATG
jgi:hypothetical protein